MESPVREGAIALLFNLGTTRGLNAATILLPGKLPKMLSEWGAMWAPDPGWKVRKIRKQKYNSSDVQTVT
jgi:hypothetical protein